MTTIPEPIYCTSDELRAELNLDDEVLDDAEATRVIQDAEDIIDRFLGGWSLDGQEETGRKVLQIDVEPWQWAKLTRAAVKLAARFYTEPSVLEQFYQETKGPDFSVSGPKGGTLVRMLGVRVLALLDDSGLRRLAGHARAGRRNPIRQTYTRFLERTRFTG